MTEADVILGALFVGLFAGMSLIGWLTRSGRCDIEAYEKWLALAKWRAIKPKGPKVSE